MDPILENNCFKPHVIWWLVEHDEEEWFRGVISPGITQDNQCNGQFRISKHLNCEEKYGFSNRTRNSRTDCIWLTVQHFVRTNATKERPSIIGLITQNKTIIGLVYKADNGLQETFFYKAQSNKSLFIYKSKSGASKAI